MILLHRVCFQLKLSEEELQRLLVEIIHDRRADLRIDQVNRVLLVVGVNASEVQSLGDHSIPASVGHVESNAIDPARASALMKLLSGLEQVTMSLSEKAV